MSLGEQAALETAVMNAIRAQLGYSNAQCARTPMGQPEPRCGNVFVSVWSHGGIGAKSKMYYEAIFGVSVTVTIRFTQPWDRWVQHYDDLSQRVHAIHILIHTDIYNYSICRQADLLANFRPSGVPDLVRPAGFVEALWFQGADDRQTQGPDWFHANIESPGKTDVGVSQELRFGGARRVQALATMT
jgi:hypothetical protein